MIVASALGQVPVTIPNPGGGVAPGTDNTFTIGDVGIQFVGDSPKFKVFRTSTTGFIFVEVDTLTEATNEDMSGLLTRVQSFASINSAFSAEAQANHALVNFTAEFNNRGVACNGGTPASGDLLMQTLIAGEDTVVTQLDEGPMIIDEESSEPGNYTVRAGTAKFNVVLSDYPSCNGGSGSYIQFVMSVKGTGGSSSTVGVNNVSGLSQVTYDMGGGTVTVEFPNEAILGGSEVTGSVTTSQVGAAAEISMTFPLPPNAGTITLVYDPTVEYSTNFVGGGASTVQLNAMLLFVAVIASLLF